MSQYNLRQRKRINYNEQSLRNSQKRANEPVVVRRQITKRLTSFAHELRFKIMKQLKHKKSISRICKIQIDQNMYTFLKENYEIVNRFRANSKFVRDFDLENIKSFFESFFCFIVENTFFIRLSNQRKVNCFLERQRSKRITLQSKYRFCFIKFCVDLSSY
jgi:hypothetical protein